MRYYLSKTARNYQFVHFYVKLKYNFNLLSQFYIRILDFKSLRFEYINLKTILQTLKLL